VEFELPSPDVRLAIPAVIAALGTPALLTGDLFPPTLEMEDRCDDDPLGASPPLMVGDPALLQSTLCVRDLAYADLLLTVIPAGIWPFSKGDPGGTRLPFPPYSLRVSSFAEADTPGRV
jgi:hypothetical protein